MNVIRNRTAPAHWSRRWLGLWTLVVCVLGVTVFLVPWWTFTVLFVLGFGVPEAIGLKYEGDAYPPLTHVIRHFVAGWLAFPLLYGVLGTFGGKALDFPRWWAIGGLCAGLGWITHHFMFTYINPDQFPRDPGQSPADLDPR
jgi:hypothetical protein